MVGLATLALCIVNVAIVHGAGSLHGLLPRITLAPDGQLPRSLGQEVLAVAVVAPLPLAVRYWPGFAISGRCCGGCGR